MDPRVGPSRTIHAYPGALDFSQRMLHRALDRRESGLHLPSVVRSPIVGQRHAYAPAGRNVGWTPWFVRDALVPLRPARGPAADQGVRPTFLAAGVSRIIRHVPL